MAIPITPTEDVEYVSPTEASERGYGSRASIHRWAQEGSIRSITVAGRLRVCAEDCEARMRENRVIQPRRAYKAVAQRLAKVAPAFTPEQKKQLVELLSN